MQEAVWENEYRNPTLVTLSDVSAKCVRDFVRFLRKKEKIELNNLAILDLGCGNGKNSLYISEQGENNKITGMDISETALKLCPPGNFIKHSIGVAWPFADGFFDIILDVTSSNSLNENERAVYLKEIARTLKPGGYLFVRGLCKDGDGNAQNLLKKNPGKEKDTYILPGVGLTERVFSKEDFVRMYKFLGKPLYIKKETHYTRFDGQPYKRNFWVGSWKK